MSKKQKYTLLKEQDIKEGLQNGTFQKENIGLIRDKEGKIVKHLKQKNLVTSIIPPNLIQINNTYIYQADIKPIIELIIETKNIELFEELEEIYHIVIDKLTHYKDHGDRLDDVNLKSLEASSIFEKRVERYLENINTDNLNEIDINKCINMLDTYINIIFIYMISTFWMHNKNIAKNTTIKRKIEKLYEKVSNIYKKLLINEINNNINEDVLSNSVYAYLFLEGGENIHLIDKLIKHDSRCKSSLDFFESYRDMCIKNFNNGKIISKPKFEEIDKKLMFSKKLYDILEKIKIVENSFEELSIVGETKIDSNTSIPLALHSNGKI